MASPEFAEPQIHEALHGSYVAQWGWLPPDGNSGYMRVVAAVLMRFASAASSSERFKGLFTLQER